MQLIAYGAILALIVVLVWPGSKASGALMAVGSSVAGTVRGA